MIVISSTSNEKFKYIRSLSKKKARTEHGEYTVEGIKSARDAHEAGAVSVFAVSESFYNTESFDFGEAQVYVVKDEIFPKLCDTQTPQGIIAIAKMHTKTPSFSADKLYIYCDGISDPGNAGTIIRTADAAGCGGVIFSKGSVDIYSPKTVRASMGSFFRMNIYGGADVSLIDTLKSSGFSIICGALGENTIDYSLADMTKPTVIVVGNEANGISREVLQKADKCVKIPIYGGAESLNAGVAAAVMMYEAVRQRRNIGKM